MFTICLLAVGKRASTLATEFLSNENNEHTEDLAMLWREEDSIDPNQRHSHTNSIAENISADISDNRFDILDISHSAHTLAGKY